MAPDFNTIKRGPTPASAFCDHCGRNLADCQCRETLARRLAADERARFNAALRVQLQQTGGGL